MSIKIILSDITKLKVDAIVSTTDSSWIPSGSVDTAIFNGAGPELFQYTATLPPLKLTEAVITPGYNLKSKYIIHVSGPFFIDGFHQEKESLYKTYIHALDLATDNHIGSIAFPIISSGAFRFPRQIAMDIAYQSFQDYLEYHDLEILLVIYDKKSFDHLSKEKYRDLMAYIGSNYVEEIPIDAYFYESINKNSTQKSRSRNISNRINDVAPAWLDVQDSFAAYLNHLMLVNKKESNEIWKKANIDRKLFSKIFNGNHPSKKTAILITLALELSLDVSLDLLARAGYTLSNSIQEDIVVRWHIENRIYSVIEVCETLVQLGLATLF